VERTVETKKKNQNFQNIHSPGLFRRTAYGAATRFKVWLWPEIRASALNRFMEWNAR
jgi:hypothetical protein